MDARDTYTMIPLFEEWKQLNTSIPTMAPCSKALQAADFRRKCIVSELYALTAEAKGKAMQSLVKDVIQTGNQFLVFCYHKQLMDEIEEAM